MRARTFWLTAAGVTGGLVVLGVIVFVPQLINLRTSLLQSFGGLLIVGGAAAAWRQVRVNRDGRITERFSRAVEHLASENTDVRIGGLDTLERISTDSPKDRQLVQSTIDGFVRDRVPCNGGESAGDAPDVQAALAILARAGLDRCDLHATDLRGADLRGASLRNASLRNACLEGADLRAADLTGADLRGADMRALNLDKARLDGAHVNRRTIWPAGFARFGVSASLFSD